MEILGDFDFPDAEHRPPEIAEADVFLRRVALVFDADSMAAHEYGGQVGVVFRVHGAAAAPNKEVVVEQATVAFLHGLKPLEEVGPVLQIPCGGPQSPDRKYAFLSYSRC